MRVRSLERFSRAPERLSRAVRGRTLAPVLIAVAVLAVVLTAGPVRPLLVYRLFPSTPLRRGPLIAGAFVAES